YICSGGLRSRAKREFLDVIQTSATELAYSIALQLHAPYFDQSQTSCTPLIALHITRSLPPAMMVFLKLLHCKSRKQRKRQHGMNRNHNSAMVFAWHRWGLRRNLNIFPAEIRPVNFITQQNCH